MLFMFETKSGKRDIAEKKTMDFVIETKALTEDGQFTAYASAFGNVDSYGDIVEKGAFLKSLREHKKNDTMPALLWQHHYDEVCGKIIDAKEDEFGLLVTGQFNLASECGKNTYAHVKAGDVKTLSIGYLVQSYDIENASKGESIRRLSAVDLWECSIVTFPANPKARVQSVKKDLPTLREFETLLQREGFTKREAQAISVTGYKPFIAEKQTDEAEATRDAGDILPSDGVLSQEEVESLEIEAFGILSTLVL